MTCEPPECCSNSGHVGDPGPGDGMTFLRTHIWQFGPAETTLRREDVNKQIRVPEELLPDYIKAPNGSPYEPPLLMQRYSEITGREDRFIIDATGLIATSV